MLKLRHGFSPRLQTSLMYTLTRGRWCSRKGGVRAQARASCQCRPPSSQRNAQKTTKYKPSFYKAPLQKWGKKATSAKRRLSAFRLAEVATVEVLTKIRPARTCVSPPSARCATQMPSITVRRENKVGKAKQTKVRPSPKPQPPRSQSLL